MKKILIIEDEVFMANIYRDKFQSEGFEVAVANDGKAAIAKLMNAPPDAVLLDLMLPEVSGVEILKIIRSKPAIRDLPVIVLSNGYVGSLMEAAWKAGANKCLTKSKCTPKHLVEEVQSVLAQMGQAAQAHTPVLAEPDAAAQAASAVGAAELYQARLVRDLQSRMPRLLQDLRNDLQVAGESAESGRPFVLLELYRGIRSLAGSAGLAGLPVVARMASALEALVNELRLAPKKVNSSTLHTVGQALDVIETLLKQADKLHEEKILSPLILVLDDEPISRETTCVALEKAGLRAISLDDSIVALKLLEKNRFDLVFLDVNMPGLDGFEVCERLHAIPANAATPVVFVSTLTNSAAYTQLTLKGESDFIAKPIILIELAVKALIHLLRPPLAATHTPLSSPVGSGLAGSLVSSVSATQ